jgi:hypothetical protein
MAEFVVIWKATNSSWTRFDDSNDSGAEEEVGAGSVVKAGYGIYPHIALCQRAR